MEKEIYKPDADTEKYLKEMYSKINSGKKQRQQKLSVFDGKSYEQYYKENERLANTMLKDGEISTGTVETKVQAVLSEYVNANFQPDVEPYDEHNMKRTEEASIYEDALANSFEKEYGDGTQHREKRMLRYSELLIQGTVIVQDKWRKIYGVKKAAPKFDNDTKKWEKVKKSYEKIYEGPEHSIVNGLAFFFGDITKRFMWEQPFVFHYDHMNYDTAKSIYGEFENFKYVHGGNRKTTLGADGDINTGKNDIELAIEEQLDKDKVEIVILEIDKRHGNHFQLFINGVPMFPIDYPLEGTITEDGSYSFVSQTFGFSKYAYGKSFVTGSSVKQLANISDLLLKLAIRKTMKSMDPPRANTGTRRYKPNILDPGKITMMSDPSVIQPIDQMNIQGVTNGEYAMMEHVQSLIDKGTVSSIFQGQEGGKVMTATEIGEVRNRAKKALAIIEFSIISLEIKMAYKRLNILNAHWFKPIGKKPVTKNGKRVIGTKHRNTEVTAEIPGRGTGLRKTFYLDGDLPTQEEVDKATEQLEKEMGGPVELKFILAKEFSEIRRDFFINVYRKPEKGDVFQQAEIDANLQRAVMYANMGIKVKPSWLMEREANAQDDSINNIFEQGQQQQLQLQQQLGNIPGVPNKEGVPKAQNMK